ncbi:hypothetical protein GCM10022378_19600 [Salinicoccus jeotgali]|uniref:Uncharacterized protein n=1 Tax=Salinicoccus jeotgali TaxID=381634 RepID=A0ABP7F4X7_9STAP
MAEKNNRQNHEGSRSALLLGCLGLIGVAIILSGIAYLIATLILGEPPEPKDVDEIKDEVSFMLETVRPSLSGKLATARTTIGM